MKDKFLLLFIFLKFMTLEVKERKEKNKMDLNELPFVSIIIVNFNGRHFLNDCLKSLERLKYPKDKFEVILVDNASSDGSVEYVKEKFPWVKILQLDKNYGFCKPNNEGAKIAKGDYLIFLNNDTIVTPEWLLELVKGVLSDKKVISCASKMLYCDKRNIINTAGGKITIVGGGFYRGYGERDNGQYDKLEYTGFGCGAGVLVEKNFFLNVMGGFDEMYFASCEEHELGLRIWMYGYKVLYVPTAVLYHKESGTYGSRSSFHPVKVYLIVRNRLFNILKNFEPINVIKGFLISIGFDLYRAIKYLLDKNINSAKAIARAYVDFIKNIKNTLKKRKKIQMKRKRRDKELYTLGVIANLKECILEEMRLTNVWKDVFFKA